MTDGPYVYRIDADDRLVFVNEEWRRFAQENEGPVNGSNGIMGKVLWDFFADMDTRHIYRQLVDAARERGKVIEIPVRCDSPAELREQHMRIVPLKDGEVEFEVRTVRTMEREPLALLDAGAPRTELVVRMCSVCKAVALDEGEWVPLEKAIELLHIFSAPRQPHVSHGMCPTCYEEALAKVEA